MAGIIGRKIGMTRVFDKDGFLVPVTVIEAGPCTVTQIKTVEKEGYNAIQLGFGDMKEKFKKVVVDGKEKKVRTFPNKPYSGIFEKNELKPKRYLKEFKVADPAEFQVGQELKADVFAADDRVDVTGISKGRGFQGVMKRYNFGGGRKTHGSMFHRHGGSIGHHSDPATVFKGRKMPGHMGHHRTTTLNLQVVSVDPEKNVILIKGSVPGHNKAVISIRRTVKTR